MIRALGVGALLAAITACSEPTAASGAIALSVSSDKDVYHLASDSAAAPILINRGTVAVYLPMNEYVAVQRFEAGHWSEPRPWFTVDGIGISFPVQPGDTLQCCAMDFGYVSDSPGVYRFVFDIAEDPNGKRLLSEALRVSPPFEIQE